MQHAMPVMQVHLSLQRQVLTLRSSPRLIDQKARVRIQGLVVAQTAIWQASASLNTSVSTSFLKSMMDQSPIGDAMPHL